MIDKALKGLIPIKGAVVVENIDSECMREGIVQRYDDLQLFIAVVQICDHGCCRRNVAAQHLIVDSYGPIFTIGAAVFIEGMNFDGGPPFLVELAHQYDDFLVSISIEILCHRASDPAEFADSMPGKLANHRPFLLTCPCGLQPAHETEHHQ